MLAWVIPAMWAAMRTLAFILQLIGLVGLMGFGFIGLMKITDRILDFEEATEGYDEDHI